jgi:hypothetical protein
MGKEEELNQQLKTMQEQLSENASSTKKPESKTGKILRTVLMFGVMALIIAVLVMGLLHR